MKYKFALPLLAALAFGAPAALAQNAPPPPGQGWGQDMQQRMAQRCENVYPVAVGKLAYLEAKLQLTDVQKPLFERWKGEMLSIVKTRTAKCGEARPPMGDDVVAMTERKEVRLKAQIADIEAQMPALKALVGSLDDQQKHILMETHRQIMRERAMHFMGGMRSMMMHRPGQGPGMAPPPPPPSAQ